MFPESFVLSCLSIILLIKKNNVIFQTVDLDLPVKLDASLDFKLLNSLICTKIYFNHLHNQNQIIITIMCKTLCPKSIQTNLQLVQDEDLILFNDNQPTCEVKWNFNKTLMMYIHLYHGSQISCDQDSFMFLKIIENLRVFLY